MTAAVHSRLVSDATLTAALTTYRGTPAVFTRWPAPEDAVMPFVVIPGGDTADAPFDSKTKLGRDSIQDVHCYTLASGSSITVEQIAERVRTLLHRHKLVIAGYGTVLTSALGPIVNDADGVYGRVVSYRVLAVQS